MPQVMNDSQTSSASNISHPEAGSTPASEKPSEAPTPAAVPQVNSIKPATRKAASVPKAKATPGGTEVKTSPPPAAKKAAKPVVPSASSKSVPTKPASRPVTQVAKKTAKKTTPTSLGKAPVKTAPASNSKAAAPSVASAAPKAQPKAPVKPLAVVEPKPVVTTPNTKVMAKAEKIKTKLIRDSFTMPENEYALISQVKKACIGAGFEIKKSELLRIGIALLAKMEPKKLKLAQQALVPLKAGRPKKK